jgi:bla regulator protein BlaR1
MIPFNTDAAELASILFDAAAKGVLLLTLGLLAVLFMKRNSAAARHLALCLAFAGLLLFPVLSWTLPQLDVLPHWMSIRPFHSTRTWQPVTNWFPPAASEHIHTKTTPSSIPSEPRLTAQGPSTGSMPIPTSANAPWSFSKWLLSIWLFGAFCVFAPTAAGLVSLWFLRRRSQVIRSGPLFALVDQLKRDISYRGRLSLLTSKIRRMPMIWGVFRPAILLPEDAVDWPEERKRVVLLHELAHIQRHDFLTTLAARLACALHWFNPLVWIAARQIRREQEQACDDVVLRMGSSAEDYAEEVLEFAAAGSAASVESLSAVAMARASSLEGRLLAILDDTRNRTSPTRTGTFAAVIASIIAMIPLSMLSAAETTRTTAPAIMTEQCHSACVSFLVSLAKHSTSCVRTPSRINSSV